MPTATATFVPFTFLKLPIELRKLIYHLLIPNLTIPYWWAEIPRPPFRDDGGPCYPAIFRLNRMIYQEVLEEWYDFVFYKVCFHKGGMRFLDWIIPLHDEL